VIRFILLILVLLSSSAIARDPDGRYAQSPLRDWFKSLRSQQGVPCCDSADGQRVEDVDWDTEGDHYRVRLDGQWIDVPDSAVIREPNQSGKTIVWPHYVYGKIVILCFLPGTMS
jgi:hypothetical protein